MPCTRGNVDAPGVFAEPVDDGARDGQVHSRDHFDFLDSLAVAVGALILWGQIKHRNQKTEKKKPPPAEWHGATP